ncbi:MAG: trigger factor [Bulleidia sp.]
MSTWTLKERSEGDLEVTIEGEEWKKAQQKAFNKIAKEVTISGFRKGTAPKAMLEKRISNGERQAKAIDDNMNEWFRKALEETGKEPISRPSVDVKEVNDEKVVLVYTFQVMPEVTVTDYRGLTYEEPDTTVPEEDIKNELERMRKQYADIEEKEGAAEEGDIVNINYEGFKDDVAFEGGKADNYDLTLGSGSFIPGFEDQLIGVSAGESKDLHLTFPEDYAAEDLAGAEVVFKVTVNAVKKEVLPEVDDDFAKDVNIPGVETAEQLVAKVRENLEKTKKNQAETAVDNALIDQIAEHTVVDLPEALIEEEVQNEIQQLANQLQQYGMSLTQYLSMMGKAAEDLKNDYRDSAIKNITIRLALEKIAEAENLVADDAGVEEEYENMAKTYGMDVAKIKAMINPEMVKKDIANQKAFELVKENAVKTVAAAE